jgi:hypothetical protein
MRLLHILNEQKSPDDSEYFFMWCGMKVKILENGETKPPDVDWHIERDREKASCSECLKSHYKATRFGSPL